MKTLRYLSLRWVGLSIGVLFGLLGVSAGTSAQAGELELVVINEVAWMGTEASYYDEWLELYNWGSADVDLTGWRLEAMDGKPKVELSGTLGAGEYYLLERTDDTTVADIAADLIYTGNLSNDGEYLQLFNADGEVVDAIDCSGGWFSGDNNNKATMARRSVEVDGSDPINWGTSAEEGSVGADADGVSITGTPGAINSLAGLVCEAIPISTARSLLKETEVCVEGCVSVKRGVLGEDIFYIQDETGTAGVRVKYDGDLPGSYRQKRLQIEGRRWEAWDEIYIKAGVVTALNDDCRRIRSRRVDTGDVQDSGDDYEGLLVDLMGNVVGTSGDVFWVDDGSGRAKIYLREEAGIEKPTTRVGYQAKIKGIVSQWGELDNGDPNFRVMPREQGDIEIQPPQPVVVGEGEVLGMSTFAVGGSLEFTLATVDIGSDPILGSDPMFAQLPITGPRPIWQLAVALLCLGLAGRLLTNPFTHLVLIILRYSYEC